MKNFHTTEKKMDLLLNGTRVREKPKELPPVKGSPVNYRTSSYEPTPDI